MSTWLDQLQPASFKGVPFKVDGMSFVAGDTTVVREYPFQDLPSFQSMGAATDEIKCAAYVIGDDYIERRDKLLNALKGEGVLVHPTRGRLRVFCKGSIEVKENPTTEGGIARMELVFVRAEKRRYPRAETNTQTKVQQSASEARVAIKADFEADYDANNLAGFARASARDDFDVILELIEGEFETLSDNVSGFKRTLRQSRTRGFELLGKAADMVDVVRDLMALPEVAASEMGVAKNAIGVLFKPRLSPVKSTLNTPTRVRQKNNQNALTRMVSALAVVEWVELSSYAQFESFQAAVELRAELSNTIKQVLFEYGDVGTRTKNALWDLHTHMMRDLAKRSQSFGRVSDYQPEHTEPLIAISYRLYDSTAYASELLANNPHIEHPLLVPAGHPIKVVNHG